MYGSRIPYLATFWIVGSRAGGLKIGPLWFYVLQIAPKSSVIYKFIGGLATWLAQHCISIVLCPPNNTQSSTIYKLRQTLGLAGSILRLFTDGDCWITKRGGELVIS